jgi:hypothetical protein
MALDDHRLRVGHRIVRRPLRKELTTEDTESTEKSRNRLKSRSANGAKRKSSVHGGGILQRRKKN